MKSHQPSTLTWAKAVFCATAFLPGFVCATDVIEPTTQGSNTTGILAQQSAEEQLTELDQKISELFNQLEKSYTEENVNKFKKEVDDWVQLLGQKRPDVSEGFTNILKVKKQKLLEKMKPEEERQGKHVKRVMETRDRYKEEEDKLNERIAENPNDAELGRRLNEVKKDLSLYSGMTFGDAQYWHASQRMIEALQRQLDTLKVGA